MRVLLCLAWSALRCVTAAWHAPLARVARPRPAIFLGRGAAGALVAASLASAFVPTSPALAASEGAAPKMEYFKSEASESGGPAVYDLGEKAALKTKMEKIIKTFEDMTSKVEVAVKAGKRSDAQAQISNSMGSLKSDVRTVTKALLGGDILSRSDSTGFSGTKEAKFDYTTGQFALKALSADAESVLSLITDLYFNSIPTAAPEAIAQELSATKTAFNIWQADAAKLLQQM